MVGALNTKLRPWSPLSCLLLRPSQEKCRPTDPQTNWQEGLLGSPQKLMDLQRHGPMVWFLRTILGCTYLCTHLCAAREGQETLLTVTGQAEHLILATGGIHFVLISVHRYVLSSKRLSSKSARGEQAVFPQGISTLCLPVGPMDLELQQHFSCQGNGFGTSLQPVLVENKEKHSQICGNIS